MREPAIKVQLPVEILEEHEGQWVAWDTETGEFLGAADTYDGLADQVESKSQNKLVGYERVIPHDAVIVGGFVG
jgi:hypothetical protein